MVKCPVLKKLQLTAREMLKWRAMSERVTGYDAAQQAVTGSLQSRVEYYNGLGDRNERRNRAGRSGSADGEAALERQRKS